MDVGRGVAVVTDSTCDLPVDLVESIGLRVVPLSVTFGDDTRISGVTISHAEFYERLASEPRLPTTSQPAPAWFEEAYADCIDDGHDAVVSLHVSAALSGTVDLARHRAATAGLPVEVVDTRLVGGALGLAALRAHRLAAAGANAGTVRRAAERVRDQALSLLVVDDLSHLKRGGRLTGAQAAMGSVLRVKPVLHVVDGRVEIRERARTWQRALDLLVDTAVEHAAGRPVQVVVVHAVAAHRAEQLARRLRQRLDVVEVLETLMGPIVGTHVGPGAVGLALVPVERDDPAG